MSDGELVPVSDIKNMEERAYRAYQMRLSGKDFEDIAIKLGYASAGSASASVVSLVKKSMNIVSADRKEEVVSLELGRLDALQESMWGIAMAGDSRAVDSVLRIMSHRAKLLMLDTGSEASVTNTVIVASENYSDSLRQIS